MEAVKFEPCHERDTQIQVRGTPRSFRTNQIQPQKSYAVPRFLYVPLPVFAAVFGGSRLATYRSMSHVVANRRGVAESRIIP
jgi:hypothetical protein